MKSLIIFLLSAFFEIAGCYSFWKYFKLNHSKLWLIPGTVSLILFAFFLTKVEVEFAGRAYAIYGGIYIVSSLLWLYFIERVIPDRWDIIGSLVCLIGISIILLMPRQ